MSESFNSVIKDLRDKPWYQIIDGFVTHIIQNNANMYNRWNKCDNDEVLSNVQKILKARWSYVAKYDHCSVGNGGNVFAVFAKGKDSKSGSRHTLYVDEEFYTCGVWQEHKYPCIHMVVYLRQANVCSSLDDLFDSKYIPFLYCEGAVKKCYCNNIIPMACSLVETDGKTTAPQQFKRAGRPKKKHIRKTSKVNPSNKTQRICSRCLEQGHNVRTCTNAPQNDAN